MSLPPDTELRQNILYDDRLDSYKTFFNHKWIREFDSIVANTPLDEAVFTLSVSWRAAANTHVMPWLMMESLRNQWNGAGKSQAFSWRIVTALAHQLPEQVPVRNMARKELAAAIHKIGDQVQAACDSPETNWDVDNCWRAFLGASYELQVAIWGTERQCFGSIYYAYEHFVCEIMTELSGSSYKMPRFKKLVEDAKEHLLPEDIVDECVGHAVVDAARRVRNALCHNGGKVTKELSGIKHGVQIQDGFLQVMPDDNHKLIRELEWRSVKLVKAALALLPNPTLSTQLPTSSVTANGEAFQPS